MFTARYGLIPYIKQTTFRLQKVKAKHINIYPTPAVFNFLTHKGKYTYHIIFNSKTISILPTQSTCVVHVILTINSALLP